MRPPGSLDLRPGLAQLAEQAGDLVDAHGVALDARLDEARLAEDVDGLQAVGDLAGVHVERGEQLVDDRLGAAELLARLQPGRRRRIEPSAWRRKRPAPSYSITTSCSGEAVRTLFSR